MAMMIAPPSMTMVWNRNTISWSTLERTLE